MMRDKSAEVLIVGAGASGLFCAALLAEAGLRVTVLEKNASAGKKLLLSGQGQCNFTHSGTTVDLIRHYAGKDHFVKPCLYALNNEALRRYFRRHGMDSICRQDGKVFPAGMRAADVVQVLLGVCTQYGVTIHYRQAVRRIELAGDGFSVFCAAERYAAPLLVLSCGGLNYPQTGSNGDGLRLAAALGHTIVTPRPAQAPLIIADFCLRDCSGISIRNARVSLRRNGGRPAQASGDVLITHQGFSGPAILDISRYVSAGDSLRLCVSGTENSDQFTRDFLDQCRRNPATHLLTHMDQYVARRLGAAWLAMAQIAPDSACGRLNSSRLRAVATLLCDCRFVVERVGGFGLAMATAGGVCLEQIDSKTMASRVCPGLFICGEILDVDGDTGGYNIQFAFSSAYCAAIAICQASHRRHSFPDLMM